MVRHQPNTRRLTQTRVGNTTALHNDNAWQLRPRASMACQALCHILLSSHPAHRTSSVCGTTNRHGAVQLDCTACGCCMDGCTLFTSSKVSRCHSLKVTLAKLAHLDCDVLLLHFSLAGLADGGHHVLHKALLAAASCRLAHNLEAVHT